MHTLKFKNRIIFWNYNSWRFYMNILKEKIIITIKTKQPSTRWIHFTQKRGFSTFERLYILLQLVQFIHNYIQFIQFILFHVIWKSSWRLPWRVSLMGVMVFKVECKQNNFELKKKSPSCLLSIGELHWTGIHVKSKISPEVFNDNNVFTAIQVTITCTKCEPVSHTSQHASHFGQSKKQPPPLRWLTLPLINQSILQYENS